MVHCSYLKKTKLVLKKKKKIYHKQLCIFNFITILNQGLNSLTNLHLCTKPNKLLTIKFTNYHVLS